jgi:hypothetical protein
MRPALKLVLVMVALLGLFAQNMASAAGPSLVPVMAAETIAPAPVACPEMMPSDGDGPASCPGMTLACIAAMGCTPAFTIEQPTNAVSALNPAAAPAAWTPVAPLSGRSIEPEPHPPSTLDRERR